MYGGVNGRGCDELVVVKGRLKLVGECDFSFVEASLINSNNTNFEYMFLCLDRICC